MKTKDAKVLSLFCGCGGLCEGFNRAGFKISASNDIWEPALMSYRHNHPDVRIFHGDIRDGKICKDIYEHFEKLGGCDVIIGGPPCQAYSMAGKRDENDPRGKLFQDYVGMVEHLRPKIFIMENVPGILTMKHGSQLVPDMIHNMFGKLGYEVKRQVLNAADYGVPQSRYRVIFVGLIPGLSFSYPKPVYGNSPLKPFITVKEALDELKDLRENPEWQHTRMDHSLDFRIKIKNTKPGENVTKYSESFWRLLPGEPSRTAKANNGSVFVHYDQDRTITAREMATLQSFGYHYRFEGTKHDVLIQICNAVPPLLGEAIAHSVKKTLGC
jgi:DNA (cytosine-5)-methyltransferase 1